jgi:SagB-type dehydrogenase family enzyme
MTETLRFDDDQTRIRRARAIVCYWKEGRLIIENYLTRATASVDPVILRILHLFDLWQPPQSALRALSEYSPGAVSDAVYQLLKRNFLIREHTEQAKRDEALEQIWADWLPHGCIHFATKDMEFIQGAESQRLYEGYLASSRPPSAFKTYTNVTRFNLPKCPPGQSEFLNLLEQRRTYREFGDTKISLGHISQLLHYTWGVVSCENTRFGPQIYKTSPSGGARHPIEVYLVALQVQGLEAGIYHYSTGQHCLELIGCSSRERAVEYCAGQQHVRSASALFMMTAVFPRSMWKYRFARAYRVVMLDAGHLGQTFCLLATQLGLAPFCTAALNDSLIEVDLGLDGISESIIYAVGVGARPT